MQYCYSAPFDYTGQSSTFWSGDFNFNVLWEFVSMKIK